MLSATLHGLVAALLLLSVVMKNEDLEIPKVFELVAGEGDNYMAREAPALGTPGGIKIDIPKASEPKPTPPERVEEIVSRPPPAPILPKPKATPPPQEQPETSVPNFKKKLQRDVIVAESRAKLQIKRERDAEAKRVAAEAKRLADEQKRMTKAEFDRANKAKSAGPTTKSAPVKVAKIDVEGISKGVVGGSTANKVGGAGGRALKSDNDDVLAAYDALFKQRLRAEFEPPPGLSDSLKAEIEVRSNADGSLSGARVAKPSGSTDFDRSVLEALRRVLMPARPDRKSELIAFTFTMRERSEP